MANVIERPRIDVGSGATANIAGIRVDGLSFNAVVYEVIARAINPVTPVYVVTPNVQHIVLLQNDPAFRKIYREAFLAVPDGVPLLWASKLLGTKLQERVNGTDLFEAICASASRHGLRVFLLGGRPEAASAAARKLMLRHPALQVCGTYCPPFGFEHNPIEDAKAVAAVRAAAPDILFVGLGAPKQEHWIARHLEDMTVPVSLGIGNSFEFVAGLVSRAPHWMQRAGLEWLHRLASEPSRLWKRYIFGNAVFCSLIARQLAAHAIVAAFSLSMPPEPEFEEATVRFRRHALLEPWHLLADVLTNPESRRK